MYVSTYNQDVKKLKNHLCSFFFFLPFPKSPLKIYIIQPFSAAKSSCSIISKCDLTVANMAFVAPHFTTERHFSSKQRYSYLIF